jgi:hypothetical protein
MARNQVQFQMETSFPKCLKHYDQEKQCQIAMDKLRWPDGFKCPDSGHSKKGIQLLLPAHCIF